MDIQVAEFEICADRVLLEQVLINLVKNAHDAIKQKDEEINESEADESPRNKTNKQI
jgi:C4-dicarboxylate-specific signal transduction histidine kinase